MYIFFGSKLLFFTYKNTKYLVSISETNIGQQWLTIKKKNLVEKKNMNKINHHTLVSAMWALPEVSAYCDHSFMAVKLAR